MKGYILGIVAAAIVCAVVNGLMGSKTATGRIAGLLSGIFLAVTAIAPLRAISFESIADYWQDMSSDASAYVTEGETMAKTQASEIIKSQLQAYILDKATRMGLEITVEVELNDDNGSIPCGVTVTGSVSPYAREQLGTFMEDNLGIAKENQHWK